MKDIAGISIIAFWWYTRGDIGIARRRGSFFLSNNHLDDVFTLKDLLGLDKNLAKNLIWKINFLDLFQVLHLRFLGNFTLSNSIILVEDLIRPC